MSIANELQGNIFERKIWFYDYEGIKFKLLINQARFQKLEICVDKVWSVTKFEIIFKLVQNFNTNKSLRTLTTKKNIFEFCRQK